MATVSAGSSASETLTGKSTITVALDSAERAIVSATRGGVEVSRATVSNGQTVGPFLSGDVVTVEALRGAVDYTVNAYSQYTAHMMTDVEGTGITAAQAAGVAAYTGGGTAIDAAVIQAGTAPSDTSIVYVVYPGSATIDAATPVRWGDPTVPGSTGWRFAFYPSATVL